MLLFEMTAFHLNTSFQSLCLTQYRLNVSRNFSKKCQSSLTYLPSVAFLTFNRARKTSKTIYELLHQKNSKHAKLLVNFLHYFYDTGFTYNRELFVENDSVVYAAHEIEAVF